MQIKIEPVKSTDVQILCDISIKCFYDTFHQQNTEEDMQLFLKENFTIDRIASEMGESSNYFFFAKVQDEIAGYIKLSVSKPPLEMEETEALEIARIYVLKDKIGSGVGKSLMDFAISFAKSNNKKTIWLGVWEHNKRAIHFYEKYCFKKFSEHIFLLGKDRQIDWLMKKELSE